MEIIEILYLMRRKIGKTKPVVQFKSPFKVLISTILSQRTRDENTERISKKLFKFYSTQKQLANASIKRLEKLLFGIGFHNVKARRIREVAKIIERKGMPTTFEGLMALPGVGRKTANCVLVFGFKKPAIPVDTHVHRISNRLGLVRTKTPEETEEALKRTIPKRLWLGINDLFVKYGRKICRPIGPKCKECPLINACKFYKSKKNQ